MKLSRMVLAGGALGVMTMLVAPGCGSPINSVCKAQCDCLGCNDSALQNCIDQGKAEQKVADNLGCGGLFDDAAACVQKNGVCFPGPQYKVTGCDTQQQKLQNCTKGH